jgi:phage shock protein PspC (stress-responsive transcriptional regulator)
MKKTVTVNLAGQVFYIDEDAFDALSSYLSAIKKMYSLEDGGDEILADIEARIAEVFLEKLKVSGKTVISISEVDSIITILGKPEELESETEPNEQKSNKGSNDASTKGEKRLYRNPDDAILAGVCSGLANYFGISDPVWIRLLFVVLVFAGVGGGMLVYIILWIVVPEAVTATQKLQMRGEAVNLENIEKTFKDGFQNVENNFNKLREDENPFNRIAKSLGQAVIAIGKGIATFIRGIFTLIFGFVVFVAAIVLFAVSISGLAVIPAFNTYIFDHSIMGYVSGIGLVLFLLSTAVFLVLLPIQILSKHTKPLRRPVSVSILGFWAIGLIMLMIGVADGTRHFSTAQTSTQTTEISAAEVPDTLIIKGNTASGAFEDIFKISIGWQDFEINEEGFIGGRVKMQLEVSPDSNLYITETFRAKGANLASATQNVRDISYHYVLNGNQLVFDDYLGSRLNSKKWREQSLLLTLKIPEGTVLAFDGVKNMIKEKPPVKSAWEGFEIPLHTTAWVIEKGYLVPLDTNFVSTEEQINSHWIDVTPHKSFQKVKIAGLIHAEIIKGDELRVLTSDSDRLDIEVSSSSLRISNKSSILRPGSAKAIKMKIYMPSIASLDIAGISKAEMTGYTRGDMKAQLAGSSTLILNGISIDGLRLNLAGASNLEGMGYIGQANIKAAGACNIKGRQIAMKDLKIDMAGACDAEVNVSNAINGKLSGASKLEYTGQPRIDVATSGSSKVSFKQ